MTDFMETALNVLVNNHKHLGLLLCLFIAGFINRSVSKLDQHKCSAKEEMYYTADF